MINFLIILYAFTYFLEIFQLFGVGGTGITINDFVTGAIVIAFLIKAVWYGEEFKIAKNPALMFFLFFCLSTFISGIGPLIRGYPFEITQYFKTTAHFHQTILFAYVILFIRIDTEVVWKFIRIWLIASIFINMFGAYQIVARFFDLPLAWFEVTNQSMFARGVLETDATSFKQLSLQFGNFFRSTSIFSEPSALAAFNTILLIFMFVPYLQTRKFIFQRGWVNFLVSFWIIVSLIISFSLTGWLGVAIIVMVALIIEKYSNLQNFFKAIMYLLPVIVMVEISIQSYNEEGMLNLIWERLSGVAGFLFGNRYNLIVGESFADRFANMLTYFTVWMHYPTIGYGFGCGYMTYYARDRVFSDTTLMQVLSELGFVGFIGFFGYFISLFFMTIRFNLKHKSYQFVEKSHLQMLRIGFYLLSFYFVNSYISANQIIAPHMYFLLFFIIGPINHYLIDYEKKYFIFKAVKVSLKKRFSRNIAAYLNRNIKTKTAQINS